MKEKLLKVAKRIFILSPALIVLIAIFSFGFIIAALTGRVRVVALECLSYVLSAYALVISVLGLARLVNFAHNGISAHPFINRVISVPIVERLFHVKHFRTEIALYPGFCMNAFYSVITAVVNLVKYRKYDSPILSAAKVINMSTALLSIFSLETAMLAQFGEKQSEHFRVTMTGLTGAGVSLIVAGMAVFMIARASILIKRNTEDGK